MSFASKAAAFVRREPVLCIAAIAALASMCVNPPASAADALLRCASSIDGRVLVLLFCLMICVAGLQRAGVFVGLARVLLDGRRSVRFASVMLVMLAFFASMFVTNDVALITFVPFSVMLFVAAGEQRYLIRVVVLQTVAANLGSMVTPFGNPQNLFLYAHFGIPLPDFMLCLAPFAAVSCVLLAVWSACVPARGLQVKLPLSEAPLDASRAVAFAVLFAVSLLAVVRVIPLQVACAGVAAGAFAVSRGVFKDVDWGLLATFVCFFVFVGNIGAVDAVRTALESLMGVSPFAVSLLASQVISNVPAAVLLAPFTDCWQGLLLGVDIGGLGTPVASLASLISLRLYAHAPHAEMGRFIAVFALANAVFLAGNCLLYAIALAG